MPSLLQQELQRVSSKISSQSSSANRGLADTIRPLSNGNDGGMSDDDMFKDDDQSNSSIEKHRLEELGFVAQSSDEDPSYNPENDP